MTGAAAVAVLAVGTLKATTPSQADAQASIGGSGGAFVAESGLGLEPASAPVPSGDAALRLRGWTEDEADSRRRRSCTPRRQAIEALGDTEEAPEVLALAEGLTSPLADALALGGPVSAPDGAYAFAFGPGGGGRAGLTPASPGAPGGGGGGPLTPPGSDTLIPTPVPEPSAWALLIVGFGAIGVALRRSARALGA